MPLDELVQLAGITGNMPSKIRHNRNENMPSDCPALKSKIKALTSNQDLNRKCVRKRVSNQDLNRKYVRKTASNQDLNTKCVRKTASNQDLNRKCEKKTASNQDLNKKCESKTRAERQRENAAKLASGRSVVDKLGDKENLVVTNEAVVKTKQRFPLQPQPPVRNQIKNDKLKSVLEERQKKVEEPKCVISIRPEEKVVAVEKELKAKPIIIEKVEESKSEIVQEEEKPKVEQIPSGVDKEKEDCEFLLGIYAADIHKFLKYLEETQSIRKEYLTPSHIMTIHMRSLLVDWLFEVQHLFRLSNETIHLAIALLDRYMQDHPRTPKYELQLVGISCTLLASKYEEMYPPDLDDLVEIAANTYTKTQILKMEKLIFSSLNYEMGRPSPVQFLKRFARAAKVGAVTYSLAKYFIDLSLVSYKLCHVPPSLMAASALYLAFYVLSNESESEFWTPTLVCCSEYTDEDLKPILPKLAAVVWNVPKSKYQAVKCKYLDANKMYSVSGLEELQSAKIYKLAREVLTPVDPPLPPQ